jgi:hypothetical protein
MEATRRRAEERLELSLFDCWVRAWLSWMAMWGVRFESKDSWDRVDELNAIYRDRN